MRTVQLTIWNRDEQRFRTLIIASIIISLVLHFLFFTALKKIHLITPGSLVMKVPDESVRLEIVESPERILPPEEEPRDTNLVSDRPSLAQDTIPDQAEETRSPRSVGPASIKSLRKSPPARSEEIQEPSLEMKLARAEALSAESLPRRKDRRKKEPRLLEKRAERGEKSPFSAKGRDEYLSPEADSPDGRTNILKQVAYNTRSTAVAEYMNRHRPRVINLWHFNVMNHTFYVRTEKTSVLLKIMPDGTLGKLVIDEHNGPDHEMFYSLDAIEQAFPFEPLTEEIINYINDDGLWIEWSFHYR